MNTADLLSTKGFGKTHRKDKWWAAPLTVFIGFGLFVLYSTWSIVFADKIGGVPMHEYGNYLSPFFSPFITPSWWPFSPGILIMWIPLGFRASCYYYRKAYYRAYFADPPGCAVGEFWGDGYKGEKSFPFAAWNLHRYFLYLVTAVVVFLWIDTVHAFIFNGKFGMGVGSILILVNVIFLSLYTFSCHSFRHIIGGHEKCFSCTAPQKAKHGLWKIISRMNEKHHVFAWISLTTVGLTDLYIKLLALGKITDIRIF